VAKKKRIWARLLEIQKVLGYKPTPFLENIQFQLIESYERLNEMNKSTNLQSPLSRFAHKLFPNAGENSQG